MSDDDHLLGKVERIVNDFGAELTVQKVIQQLLLAQILMSRPDLCEERLEEMRAEVAGILGRMPIDPQDDPAGQQRSKVLAIEHGARFFREVAAGISAMRNRLGQSGRH